MTFWDYVVATSVGIGASLTLTVGGFVIGAILGLPLALARNSRLLLLRMLGAGYVDLLRGIPPIAWLFLLYFGLPQFGVYLASLPAAIVGLGAIAAAYLCEIYRSGLRSVDAGQAEAGRALGLRRGQIYRLILAPQALPTVVAPAIAFGIGLLKDSAAASAIGVAEVTAIAVTEARANLDGLTVFTAAGVIYLAVSVPVGALGRWAGDRLATKVRVTA